MVIATVCSLCRHRIVWQQTFRANGHEFHDEGRAFPKERYGWRSVPILSYSSKVNRLKGIMSVIVLALWASCTIHCELEMFASAKASSCCQGDEQRSGKPASPESCVCTVIASGGYTVQKNAPVAAPAPEVILEFTEIPQSEDALREAVVEDLIFAPPELPRSWQFSLRTALPPRAPSFVS